MRWLKKLLGNKVRDAEQAEPVETAAQKSEASVAPRPINEIEEFLFEAAVNADARPGFERALLEAKLFVATPAPPAIEGMRTVGEGEYLNLMSVRSPDGALVTAIFTAQERIADVFGDGVGFVAMQGRELLSLVESGGAWLNPGFPYSVHWAPDHVTALLGKPVRHTVAKDTNVMLGTPANPPTALIRDLQQVLSGNAGIIEAWFALAHWPDEERSAWFLDIRASLSAEEVRALLDETLRNADYAGQPLDMVVNRADDVVGAGIRLVPVETH
ncbi:MAG: enhanced serine sensitivity protein SseB C-terminal domain-containing protein [Candidatus Devosia phytovorans]|uniref:Enhanced serine sensitivity protein SseB C-terminal domain-containing protein n=1 Tax=Candidatus Devosia phytovorans TaxID=3121372 RepID=A0AAJ5VRJ0_9HYPH|nr:enhanced serine sensitivity protein SseB C-terminal domain-containing protein [Devosia sp.]WEK02881.1 MAG: enhanced serine sensitivity protein SseB C-terminal domain-containing protein [Devosia sp.]